MTQFQIQEYSLENDQPIYCNQWSNKEPLSFSHRIDGFSDDQDKSYDYKNQQTTLKKLRKINMQCQHKADII